MAKQLDNWIVSMDLFFDLLVDEQAAIYNGEYFEINVRTYHLEKYQFEGEYNLEVTYPCEGTMVRIYKIDDIANIKSEADKHIKFLEKSRYRAKISINGRNYRDVVGSKFSDPNNDIPI